MGHDGGGLGAGAGRGGGGGAARRAAAAAGVAAEVARLMSSSGAAAGKCSCYAISKSAISKAVIAISAHWLTPGKTLVCAIENPKTIYDFGRFDDRLFDIF